jgi:hypothetical protein
MTKSQTNKQKIDAMPKEQTITRAYAVEDFKAQANESENKIIGHASVFGRMTNIGGWFNEIIERGAFDAADLTDVFLFVNHDMTKIPLARSRRNNGNSTMTLSIDEIGLMTDATLDVERNTEAKNLYSAVDRGDISGMSFSFRIKEDKWENLDSDMPTRRITKIAKVYEVSAVNMPAYIDTDINARDQAALENARHALESAKELESSESSIEVLRLRNQILSKG